MEILRILVVWIKYTFGNISFDGPHVVLVRPLRLVVVAALPPEASDQEAEALKLVWLVCLLARRGSILVSSLPHVYPRSLSRPHFYIPIHFV